MDNDALLALASDLVAKAASAIMAIKAAGFAVERNCGGAARRHPRYPRDC
jgi:hypothetical protein